MRLQIGRDTMFMELFARLQILKAFSGDYVKAITQRKTVCYIFYDLKFKFINTV